MSDSSFSKGIGLAIAASVFWGSMGVCAQYLLQQCSFTPLDLVSMRLVLAGLILLIMERLVFGRNIISAAERHPYYGRDFSCRSFDSCFSAHVHACGRLHLMRERRHCAYACAADLRLLALYHREASFDNA